MPFPQTPNLLNLLVVFKVFILEYSKTGTSICLHNYHVKMGYSTIF